MFLLSKFRPFVLSVIANMLGFKTSIDFGFMFVLSVSLSVWQEEGVGSPGAGIPLDMLL